MIRGPFSVVCRTDESCVTAWHAVLLPPVVDHQRPKQHAHKGESNGIHDQVIADPIVTATTIHDQKYIYEDYHGACPLPIRPPKQAPQNRSLSRITSVLQVLLLLTHLSQCLPFNHLRRWLSYDSDTDCTNSKKQKNPSRDTFKHARSTRTGRSSVVMLIRHASIFARPKIRHANINKIRSYAEAQQAK